MAQLRSSATRVASSGLPCLMVSDSRDTASSVLAAPCTDCMEAPSSGWDRSVLARVDVVLHAHLHVSRLAVLHWCASAPDHAMHGLLQPPCSCSTLAAAMRRSMAARQAHKPGSSAPSKADGGVLVSLRGRGPMQGGHGAPAGGALGQGAVLRTQGHACQARGAQAGSSQRGALQAVSWPCTAAQRLTRHLLCQGHLCKLSADVLRLANKTRGSSAAWSLTWPSCWGTRGCRGPWLLLGPISSEDVAHDGAGGLRGCRTAGHGGPLLAHDLQRALHRGAGRLREHPCKPLGSRL